MAIRYEHSGNAAQTTLASAIAAGSTAINVASAVGWPTGSTGPFWVTIDAGTASEEKVLIASRSGTVLTVSARGADSTAATSHASGAAIIHSFSATEADDANRVAAEVDAVTGALVGDTAAQTLTNKTLTAPVVNNPTVAGGTFDTPLGRRNVVRNGDMGVYQRGSWATNAYGVDGWRAEASGGTVTPSRQATAVGSGLGANGAAFTARLATSGQSLAGDYARLAHRVEGVRTLAGKQVTLSFMAAAGAGTPRVAVELQQVFGSGGTPSATVQTAVQAVTVTTTPASYTVTFTVPSVSGKTLGTAGDDYLELGLWTSAGANYAARASSIGIQNATIDITDVQLEQGGATPFERLSQQEQLALCQRHFVRFPSGTIIGTGYFGSATTAGVLVVLPVPMRATPTDIRSGGWNFKNSTYTVVSAATATFTSTDYQHVFYNFSGTTTGTAGGGCLLETGTGTIDFTAEL